MAKKKLEEVKKINYERLMSIENLTAPLLYDIPVEYVNEMSKVFAQKSVIEELLKTEEREKYLKSLSDKVCNKLFELEKKYMDRTGEVINFVAQKTGIYFPHVFQRLVEYFYIGTRPADRYYVSVSTIRELKIDFPSCSFKKILIESGVGDKICMKLCESIFKKISNELKLNIHFSIKQEPGIDYCEHQFFLKEHRSE